VQRILLVDDDVDVRPLLEIALRSVGYEFDSVATVAAARSHVAQQSYALLVTDKRLPDGDGLQIADEAAARGTQVIVLSGYVLQGSSADRDRHEHIMKPIRPTELLKIVEQRIGPPQRIRHSAGR
jgi:two-component system response regulator PilR (NtrC family)